MAEQVIPPVIEKPAATAAPSAEELDHKARVAEIKATGAKLKAEKNALNRQRADILEQEKGLKKEREELAEFKRWRAQATTDPDQFLAPIYGKEWRDVLAKATAGDATPLEIRKLREEWEAERKANAKKETEREEEDRKAQEDAAKKAQQKEEEAFNGYMEEINTTWIKEHEKDFPSIAATGLGYQIAVNVRALHQNGGKVGDREYKPGEVPDELLVAKDLEEKLDKLLDTVYATPKWKERLAAVFKPVPVERKKEPPLPYQYVPRKAISQDMAASGAAKEQQRPLDREARKARLLAKTFDPVTGTFK